MLPLSLKQSAHPLIAFKRGQSVLARAALMTLPPEIVTAIIEELDWYSLMNVRKTCRYFYHISKSLSVWRSQLHRYRAQHKYTSRLDAPLEAYSASDLEEWVTRRISADAGWKSKKTKPTRIRYIREHTASGVCLVPGGRWLLMGGNDGSVTVYDLDSSSLDGELLLQLPDHREIYHICIDIDEDSPNLAFTMALSPTWHDSDSDAVLSIHIWAVAAVGHGRKAYLKASHLRSFEANVTAEITITGLTLHRHLLGRLIFTSDLSSYVEVFDWTMSTSSYHCKTVLAPEGYFDCIRLLSGNRLLVFSGESFMIYDIRPVVYKEPSFPIATTHSIEPSWKLPCPPNNRTRQGGLSLALIGATSTYFTFMAGNIVHGLAIPHKVQEPPQTFELAQFPGPRFPDLALGFEKMFAHHHRESAMRLGFGWNEERPRHADGTDPAYIVKAREYSADWNIVWPPVLDEGSGRIVQSLINGVLVMDTALFFTEPSTGSHFYGTS